MKDKVFITGGSGFIGSHLSNRLSKQNFDVFIYDNFYNGKKEFLDSNVNVIKGDIRNRSNLSNSIEKVSPDYIFHLAALHFIPYCKENKSETFDVNIKGTEVLLDSIKDYSKKSEIKKLIFTSSAAVYKPSRRPHKETSEIGPIDIYGITKYTNELQLNKFANLEQIDCISVRLFNVYGNKETNPHLIPEILEQFQNGNRKIKLGNLNTKRSFVHVNDVTRGLVKFMDLNQRKSFDVFNLGSEQDFNAAEVVNALSKVVEEDLYPETVSEKRRSSDRPKLKPNLHKIKKDLNWKEDYSLQKGLKQTLNS